MIATSSGPAWSAQGATRYPGRYPLAVEGYALARVAELVPGVTTVTPHARYFALHSHVAAEADRRDLGDDERLSLLRRSEVVVGAVSILHARSAQEQHNGLSAAHGADAIEKRLDDHTLPVASLARPGQYAESARGFLGPYVASERLLGLVADR